MSTEPTQTYYVASPKRRTKLRARWDQRRITKYLELRKHLELRCWRTGAGFDGRVRTTAVVRAGRQWLALYLVAESIEAADQLAQGVSEMQTFSVDSLVLDRARRAA